MRKRVWLPQMQDRDSLEARYTELKQVLGNETFQTHFASGYSLNFDEAVAYVLELAQVKG